MPELRNPQLASSEAARLALSRLLKNGHLRRGFRAVGMGRNPATGEAIKIKASKKVAFRPSKELKLAV